MTSWDEHAKGGAHAKATEDLAAQAGRRHFGVGVMNHVGIALELREVIAAQRLRLEEVRLGGRTRHGVNAEGGAVCAP